MYTESELRRWKRCGNRCSEPAAFTLLELLVVVGIIAILAGLLLPALSAAKSRALSARCLSNMKQFGLALQLYAGDHQDLIPPNKDGQGIPLGEAWVEGWLGLPGPDCTNVLYLRRSLIGKYIGEPKIWRCPAAKDPKVGTSKMPRVRTVSLNGFLGAPTNAPGTTYRRLGEITRPAETLAFLEERAETINDGCFSMQWNFDKTNPQTWILRDKPAVIHRGAANLSFADGHVAARRWRDERTLTAPRDDALMPGNVDVLWLQEHGKQE